MYKCPKCGSPLYKKDNISGIGQFYNCEHCGYIKSSWDTNNLNTANFADSTLNRCPRCGGAIIQKLGGPQGVFYGCVNYPRCNFAYSSSDQNVSQTFTYAKDHTTNPRYYGDSKPQIRPKEHTNHELNNIYGDKNYIITDIISKQNKSNSSKKSQDKSKRKNELYEYLNNYDNVKNKVMIERRIKAGEITTTQEIDKIFFEKPKTNKNLTISPKKQVAESRDTEKMFGLDSDETCACLIILIVFLIYSLIPHLV